IGSYFKQRLQELQDRHQLIGDVRGIGLMLSIELVANRETKERFPADLKVTDRLTAKFKRAGLLLRAHGNTLVNFSPPLCITRDEVDEVVTTVDHSLGEIEREL
ncbi:MAG: aminotransferase class III-fold pyridoxal phosphate-dependent enzyme, partial [Pirellulaceae bacterium]|nr:aminotransferase class III-fold pyridoxal phosphate-dependent enzyme [Pirellulaceae bacterium]